MKGSRGKDPPERVPEGGTIWKKGTEGNRSIGFLPWKENKTEKKFFSHPNLERGGD